eukprot:16441457-Heterocapsa_arctica.AAC.1
MAPLSKKTKRISAATSSTTRIVRCALKGEEHLVQPCADHRINTKLKSVQLHVNDDNFRPRIATPLPSAGLQLVPATTFAAQLFMLGYGEADRRGETPQITWEMAVQPDQR